MIALGILAVLFGALLVLLPYGIDYGIERWMRDQGAQTANVGDVDFNPFTGRLSVTNVAVMANKDQLLDVPHAQLQLAWQPLFGRKLSIQSLSIDDAHLNIRHLADGTVLIGGILKLTPGAGGGKASLWGFGIDSMAIHNSRLTFIDKGVRTRLAIQELSLERMLSWLPLGQTKLHLRGQLNKAALALDATATPFSLGHPLKATLKLQGLALEPFLPYAQPALQKLGGKLSLNLSLEANQSGGAWQVKQQGNVTLSSPQVTLARGETFQAGKLDWNGVLDLTLEAKGRPTLDSEGTLTATGLDGLLARNTLHLSGGQLDWKGTARYSNATPPWQADGNLTLGQLLVEQPPQKRRLASADTLTLNDLHAEAPAQVTIKQLSARLLRLMEPEGKQPSPLLTVGNLSADQAQLSPQQFIIDTVTLRDMNALARRNQDGSWYPLASKPATQKPGTPANTGGEAATATTPHLKVARVTITGKSQIRFEDRAVKPPYAEILHVSQARITGIDNAKSTPPAQLMLKGQVGKYAQLTLNGQVQPFAPRLTLNIDGNLRDFDLPPLSSYTAPKLGYNLSSGHLNAELKLKADAGKLDGSTNLRLNNLELEPQSPDKMAQLTTRLGMPLDAALSLLRDSDNDIRIKLPISGDIADPKFDFADTINQALGKAMRTTAVAYLKNLFQPFGTLITVAQLAGNLTALRLDPVTFPAGSQNTAQLDAAYLKKVGTLMQERPELRIRLCGHATAQDRNALRDAAQAADRAARQKASRENADNPSYIPPKPSDLTVGNDQLEALAQARAARLKDLLVRSYGISPERLFVCRPEVDKDAEAKPRVELLI